MAAAAVMEFCASATKNDFGLSTKTETQWDELDLQARLELIARAWILTAPVLSSERNHEFGQRVDHNVVSQLLVLPDPTPKRSRRLSKPCDEDHLPSETPIDPTRTCEAAHQRNPFHSTNHCSPPPPDDSRRRRGQRKDLLISDPTSESYLDFSSEAGFIQHAKKKKSKGGGPVQKAKKDEVDEAGKGGGSGGDQNGDTGKSGGDAGDGNGDDKEKDKDKDKDKDKGEDKDKDNANKQDDNQDDKQDDKQDDNQDDTKLDDNTWDTFETAGKKKKKVKSQVEEKTEIFESSTKKPPETFQEIKLNDSSPSLDTNLNNNTPETKSGLFSVWGSRLIGGWGVGLREAEKSKEEEPAATPWSLDRPNPKKKDKTTFSFGSYEEAEDSKTAEPPAKKKDDLVDLDFDSTTKDAKKKSNVWSISSESEKKKIEPPVKSQGLESAVVEDPWGGNAWNTTTKNKAKKGAVAAAVAPMVEAVKADKKKKKGASDEVAELPSSPPEPEPEPEPVKRDIWADWGTEGTTKSKKKKGMEEVKKLEPESEPGNTNIDDNWGWGITGDQSKETKIDEDPISEEAASQAEVVTKKEETVWNTKKKSKKNKNAVLDSEPVVPPVVEEIPPEPEPEPVAESKPEKEDDSLPSFGVPKKKKGKKSKVAEVVQKPVSELGPESEPLSLPEPRQKEDDWDALKKGKKDKVVEEVKEPELEPEPEPEPVPEEEPEPVSITTMLTSKEKKKKKKKNSALDPDPPSVPEPEFIPEPAQEPDPEPEPVNDQQTADVEPWTGADATKKKGKKKKKDAIEESRLEPISNPEPKIESEIKPAEGDWDVWGNAVTKDNKKKKSSILDELSSKRSENTSASAAPPAQIDDDKDATSIGYSLEEKAPESKQFPQPAHKESSSAWSFWGAKKSVKKQESPAPTVEEDGSWLSWPKKIKNVLVETDKESEHSDQSPPPVVPEAPSATGDDDFWGSQTNKDNTGSGSLIPDSIEEPKNDDAWGLTSTSKKDKKKKKGGKNVPVEIEDGSHLNGVKPDSVEEGKDGKDDFDDWGWGSLGKNKTSPPPAPTPPSLNMSLSGQELEENVWDDAKADHEEQGDEEAAALAAEIAAEEAELADLKTKAEASKAKKKKLGKANQKRLDELTENAKRRADEKADKEAEEAARRKAEEMAAVEAKEAEEKEAAEAREAEEKAAAEELAAEIAAEEEELAKLTNKRNNSKKQKLGKTDQKRFNELTERREARAEEQAANDEGLAAQEAKEQAAKEAEEQAAQEAEERAAQEAEEQAEREERAAREAEEEATCKAEEEAKREREEAEAAAKKKSKKSSKLEEKKSKSSSSKDKASKKDKEREKEREREEAEEAEKEIKKNKYDDYDDDLDLDNIDLPPEQVDELLSGLSSPKPPPPVKSEPFSFWGAKSRSPLPEQVFEDATVEDAPSSYKATTTDDDWLKPKKTKVKSSKLADKLKKFEPAKEEDDDADNLIDSLSAPPPPSSRVPVAPRVAEDRNSRSSRDLLPGAFPNEEDENEIVDIVDMAPVEKKKKGKKSKAKAVEIPPPPPAVHIPPPPPEVPVPPPAAPDAPLTPPPEVKSSKKERAKISRDGGASWGAWGASATPRKEEKKPKPRFEEKKPRKVKEEKSSSSKGSSSDRDNRTERTEGTDERREKKPTTTPKLRTNSIFQSTPPISRSMSTRDKRHGASKSSSRRHSVDMSGGLVSPPPEDLPTMSSKAARVLGVDKPQKSRSRKSSAARAMEEDDIVMVGARDVPSSPEKPTRRRSKPKAQEDIDMIDTEFPNANPMRRSNSGAKKGITGLFGGLMSSTPRPEPRPEPRRRNTYYTTDDDFRTDKRAGRSSRDYRGIDTDAIDEEREARRAARRARKAEERAAEEARLAREEERRERRRRHEEEAEMRRQADREARRAERRAAREREAERLAAEAKEAERAERRRIRKLEKEAAAAEEAEAEARRAARAERRRSRYVDPSEDEEERRRRRHEARRAEEKTNRRRSMPVDDYGYPQERTSRYAVGEHRRSKTMAWPHSGTDSWVKEHSDAGPPPEDGPSAAMPVEEDDEEARRAARRAARRRAKYGDMEADLEDDRRRRRARREERDRRDRRGVPGGSDGSGGAGVSAAPTPAPDRGPRESFFTDSTPRSSWWKKLTGA